MLIHTENKIREYENARNIFACQYFANIRVRGVSKGFLKLAVKQADKAIAIMRRWPPEHELNLLPLGIWDILAADGFWHSPSKATAIMAQADTAIQTMAIEHLQ